MLGNVRRHDRVPLRIGEGLNARVLPAEQRAEPIWQLPSRRGAGGGSADDIAFGIRNDEGGVGGLMIRRCGFEMLNQPVGI